MWEQLHCFFFARGVWGEKTGSGNYPQAPGQSQAGATTGTTQPSNYILEIRTTIKLLPTQGGFHVGVSRPRTKTTSPWSLKNFRFLERFKDAKAKGGVPLLCCGGIQAPTGSSVQLRGCPSLRRHADELRDDGPLRNSWTEVTLSIRHYPLPSVNHF